MGKYDGSVPVKRVLNLLKDSLPPDEFKQIGREVMRQERSLAVPRLPSAMQREETMWTTRVDALRQTFTGELQNKSKLTYEQMERMRVSGAIRFILSLKKMPIISLFRKERGTDWRINTRDQKQKEALEALFGYVRMDFIKSALNSLDFGFQPYEMVFRVFDSTELNLEGNSQYYGYSKLKDIYPPEVTLRFDDKGNFLGLTQYQINSMRPKVELREEKSLVITNNKEYGNLYGETELLPMYIPWFWYESVARSMLRYMERVGQPLVVVYGPRQNRIMSTTTGRTMNAMQFALETAINAGKSNAVALPSDHDPNTRQPLWKIEYLQDQQRGDQFRNILEYLNVLIMRAGTMPDTASTNAPPGSTGSYNMAEAHQNLFLQAEETLLEELVSQINNYVLPPLVEYNFGEGIFAQMETSDLDRSDLDRSFSLMSAITNVHPDVPKFDLAGMAEKLGIPYDDSLPNATDIEIQKEETKAKLNPRPAVGSPGQPRTTPPRGGKPRGGNQTKPALTYPTDTRGMFEILTDNYLAELEHRSINDQDKQVAEQFVHYASTDNHDVIPLAKQLAEAVGVSLNGIKEIEESNA